MHYAIQDFVHKTLGTRLVPDYGHALRGFMHNDLMHCENFICIANLLSNFKYGNLFEEMANSSENNNIMIGFKMSLG
jgi:hypothetical protein